MYGLIIKGTNVDIYNTVRCIIDINIVFIYFYQVLDTTNSGRYASR